LCPLCLCGEISLCPLQQIFCYDAPLLARPQNLRLFNHNRRIFVESVSVTARTGGDSLRNDRIASFANLIQVWLLSYLGCFGRPFRQRHNQIQYAETSVREQDGECAFEKKREGMATVPSHYLFPAVAALRASTDHLTLLPFEGAPKVGEPSRFARVLERAKRDASLTLEFQVPCTSYRAAGLCERLLS
jgi:hypothetical protein